MSENVNNDVVNVHYQLNLLLKISVILLISSIASGLIFYNFVNYEVGNSYTNARFVVKSVRDFMFPSLWFAITIFTLLMSLGTMVASIFVSHKIAGPLYRLEKVLSDYSKGNFYRVRLRPKDQVKEFVNLLNTFIDNLYESYSQAEKHSVSINKIMEEMRAELDIVDVDFSKISTLVDSLRMETDKINELMSDYKTV